MNTKFFFEEQIKMNTCIYEGNQNEFSVSVSVLVMVIIIIIRSIIIIIIRSKNYQNEHKVFFEEQIKMNTYIYEGNQNE